MSKDLIEKAKEYIDYQLCPIPILGENDKNLDKKKPALYTWEDLQRTILTKPEAELLFSGARIREHLTRVVEKKDGTKFTAKGIKAYQTPKAIGIITGHSSGGLEVIDVDTKHDTTGSLWEELRILIQDNLPELYERLVIAQTVSGGYHIYYRCSSIVGNIKLAKAENESALIETRGEGGYVIAYPTPGYTYIQGEPGSIPTITPEEREILFSIAKSFNEIPEAEPKLKAEKKKSLRDNYPGIEKTSLEDYDERGDVIGLLISRGWSEVGEKNNRIYLLRPGETSAQTSGNYLTTKRSLIVFSTSTEFTAGKPYSPSEVYNLLNCNGDWSKTALELGKQGYGDYKPKRKEDKEINTSQIKVDAVNKVNGETSVISTPGDSLKLESLQTATGDFIITSPGAAAEAEVLTAIDLIQETGKRIYVKEGAIEVREYRYQLQAILKKYGAIQHGGLTDIEQDNLLDEVVTVSTKLQPIDRDLFKKEFLELEPIKELGISEENLSITVDRLTATIDKEAQAKELGELLDKVKDYQDKGEIKKALELLDSKVKEVKLQDKATEFSRLLIAPTEGDIKKRLSNKTESINSGYTIGGEPLLLPAGAISIFAAPTSHGKTAFLINLALNIATTSKEKEVYLFSYEEDADSILIKSLNTYHAQEVSPNNRRALANYFATGDTAPHIRQVQESNFIENKDRFFRELIETRRLNIHYTNYNSDTLIDAIRYLHKHAKLGAIFIDYIQLLNLPEGKYKTYSRQEEMKEICIALKDLAVETGLPIILGAQFNRKVVHHLKIHATEIGEAGDIERIANLIVGFWNNNFEPVGTEGELKDINAKNYNQPGTLYTTILKNRDGKIGLWETLNYNGNTGKIANKGASEGRKYFK